MGKRRYTIFAPTVAKAPAPPPSKRGLAGVVFTEQNNVAARQMMARCSWFHNWTAAGHVDGLEFVPFLWGKSWPSFPDLLTTAVDALGADYSGRLLWLNEPNDANQANLTPAQAVQFYRATRLALPHAQLIGPNMSFYDGDKWASDARWLQLFMEEMNRIGEPFDFVGMAVHNYLQDTADHIRLHGAWVSMLAELGLGTLPLWVTEWGIDTRHGDAAARVQALCQFYDSYPTVARHAWYIHHAWDGDTFPVQSYLHNNNAITAAGAGWLA